MNDMIDIDGKKLRIVRYIKPLYRADRTSYMTGRLASNNYSNAPMKYFTLNKTELKTYIKYGMPYVKTWEPQEELILIDILHTPTRKNLSELIGENSLKISFPLNGNKVSRVSEEDTKKHDDIVLKALCDLGLDGYFMDKLTKNGKYVFHSEVGLCPKAFTKLELISVNRNRNEAPPIASRKKRRYNNNNNNTRRNTAPSRLFF